MPRYDHATTMSAGMKEMLVCLRQFCFLGEQGGQSIADLARMRGVTRGAIVSLVATAEARGYVRVEGERGRWKRVTGACTVRLTEAGRKALPSAC